MVRTRHSEPAVDATPEKLTLDENGQPKAVTRALKKLLIDANAALKGDQEEEKPVDNVPKKVYHWRGAVYEMTDDTLQEWVDQEPERYRKRKRQQEERDANDTSVSMMDDDEEEEEDEAPPPPKRKRGRPRKHPLPEEVLPRPSLKRKREESSAPPSSHKKTRDVKDPSLRKTRSQGAAEEASKSARDKAKDKGYQIESIPWADMMTGRIAVDLIKFCAVQSELRKIKAEYQRASDLHEQLERRAKEQRNETDAPPTPDPETNDIEKPEQPASGVSGVRSTPKIAYQDFGPWDTPPKLDDRGRPLHWSLQTARDMEGRAEFHIYMGKVHSQEKQEDQTERIRREKALVQKWEKGSVGVAYVHDEDGPKASGSNSP